jgi:Ni/Fe-hydrogenase subunit HybB-like protein
MTPEKDGLPLMRFRPVLMISLALTAIGLIVFLIQAAGPSPERAWQAYLINFLLFSGIAQGGFLFSTVMHLTGARWSRSMAGVAEAFAGFFPVSFVLFLLLFFGREHLFPWLHEDLHGKEIWLNLPFLMTRNAVGLLLLYGFGFAYLHYALDVKREAGKPPTDDPDFFDRKKGDATKRRARMTLFGILYTLSFAVVLSLLGYDLVMSLDPHWYSTLFGAYTFVKAFYVGLAGLIILAAFLKLRGGVPLDLQPVHFHDVGKLFFGFCLVWADFFYCQLVVIWYGNIPEESAYVITRVVAGPYNSLAWGVFLAGFVLPFFILLNKKIKTRPLAMIVICAAILVAIWLEHLLLVGPALFPHGIGLPLGVSDGIISLGFLGLMAIAVTSFLNRFPELVLPESAPGIQKEGH